VNLPEEKKAFILMHHLIEPIRRNSYLLKFQQNMKYLYFWNNFFHVSVKDSVTEMVILCLLRTMTTYHDALANTGYDALELPGIYI